MEQLLGSGGTKRGMGYFRDRVIGQPGHLGKPFTGLEWVTPVPLVLRKYADGKNFLSLRRWSNRAMTYCIDLSSFMLY